MKLTKRKRYTNLTEGVLFHTLSREIMVALVRTAEAWSVELTQDLRAFSELCLLTRKWFTREYNIVEFDYLPIDIMHKNAKLNRAIFEAAMVCLFAQLTASTALFAVEMNWNI